MNTATPRPDVAPDSRDAVPSPRRPRDRAELLRGGPGRAGGALLAVAVLGLAACTGGGGSTAASSSSTSTTPPVVAASIAPVKPQRAIPADKDIVEVPKLRDTIALTGCAAADKGWSGTGTAKNPGTTDATYHILVFFTDQYSRTIDYAKTDVKVAPGKSASWSATAAFTPPKGTQCVLRGLSQSTA